MAHRDGSRIRPSAPRRLLLALLVAALVAAGHLPDAGSAAHGAGSVSRNGGNTASPVSWTVRLDSRFAGGKAGTWPTGPRDNGTAALSQGRYLLHATDGYTTTRTPGDLPASMDGRIQATVRAVGRGNVGVYGRWSSTNGQPNLLACWFRNNGAAGCTNWQAGIPTDLVIRHESGIHPNADNQLVLQITKNQLQFQINGRMVLDHALGGPTRAGAWGIYVSTTLRTAPTQGAYSRVTIAVPGVPRSVIAAATQTAVRAGQTATASARKAATAQVRQTATSVAQATQTALALAQATQTAVKAQAQETAQAQATATALTAQAQATQGAAEAQGTATAQAQQTATVAARNAVWTIRSSGTTSPLNDVSCPSPTQCVAVGGILGGSGTILTSNDGGTSWISRTPAANYWLSGVSCPSTSLCVVVGQDYVSGTILTSADGGASWITRWTSDTGTYGYVNGVSCATASTCVAVGANNTIVTTSDGGATWTNRHAGGQLAAVSCASPSTCVAVFGGSTTSTDGGATWTDHPGTIVNSVSCPNSDTCVAVGGKWDATVNGKAVLHSASTILTSLDGGVTWTSQPSGTNSALNGVSCLSTSTCVAVGDGGTILTTADGGLTWTSRTTGTSSELDGVSCSSVNQCVVVGKGGTILTTGT